MIVPPVFERLPDVIAGLAELERAFVAVRDRRGIFAATYLVVTQTVQEWIEGGRFLDREKVARYVVAFANTYRQALARYETGQRSEVPGAWLRSFDASRSLRASVYQQLLLGVNAHINHDLPHAVLDAGLSVACERCYRDHTLLNDATRAAIPHILRRVAALYQLTLYVMPWMFGRITDEATALSFRRARENSWTWASVLALADPGTERDEIGRLIDERAALAAEIILGCRFAPARALATLYEVERLRPCPTRSRRDGVGSAHPH